MSNILSTIGSAEEAQEVIQQYLDLGLPMPVDLLAHMEQQGFILDEEFGEVIQQEE